MIDVQGKTVREVALEVPVATRVFEEFKIDYCCHGNTLFDDACRNVGARPETVMQQIDGVLDIATGSDPRSFSEMELGDLIDHILDKHHVYTKNEMQQLTTLMAKVAGRHGECYQYLLELKDLFHEVCYDLEPHMMKEEVVLFPYIKRLDYDHANNFTTPFSPFGSVQNPIAMMNVEHEKVGELLSKMRSVTNDYTLPNGACASFAALYARLVAFEHDIHQHIHLENNLLFPLAVELEQKELPPFLY